MSEEKRKHAERLHHLARVKARVRWMLARWDREGFGPPLADDPRFVGRYTHTRKPCSCAMCYGRRRTEGPTRRERLPLDYPASIAHRSR